MRCGAHDPKDVEARNALIRAHEKPCQMHNNCSGKHAGFLALARHLGLDKVLMSRVLKAIRNKDAS